MNTKELIDITTKKNVILDSQILTSLMGCPRLTDFRFNMNLQSVNGKSNSLECGSIVHKFIEVYYKSIIKGIKRDDAFGFGYASAQLYIQGCSHCTNFQSQVIKNLYDSPASIENTKPECNHQPNEYPGVTNTQKESEGYKIGWQHVLDTCEQYHQFYRNDHWIPLEIEVVKKDILYEDDEIRILWKAKLDSRFDTNQGIFPVDHKTMKQRRDTVSLNNQFIGQCILSGTRQLWLNKIGFQTSLKPEEKFQRISIGYSASQLMEWQSEILPYYAKLLLMYHESGYFPPNFEYCDRKYGNCAFLDVCKSPMNMREDELKRLFVVGPKWEPLSSDSDE